MNPAVDNATGTGSARNRRNSLDAERIINAVLDQLSLNVTMESPPVESLATRLRELRKLVG
jgi:hypothetical protein